MRVEAANCYKTYANVFSPLVQHFLLKLCSTNTPWTHPVVFDRYVRGHHCTTVVPVLKQSLLISNPPANC